MPQISILAATWQLKRRTASVDHAPNCEKNSWNEVRQLNADPLFTIGGYSLYRDVLSCLVPEVLGKEIRASVDLLETNLNSPITHYSHLEGQRQHYND